MSDRHCPLCDAPQAGRVCPTHNVPTIDREGPRGPLERLEIGTVLVGRYRIEGLLQQGGMGVLLDATRLQDDRRVVLKVLKGQRLQDFANIRRFYQEARVASSLDHPNIVRIFEFGVDEATRAPFLAMELVAGRTLKSLVAREGPLDERRTARLFAQIASGLEAAHLQGILHRDLKPSNVMVRPGPDGAEQVKVLDFGLAKIIDDGVAPLTMPGKTVGTPAFMSPEQVSQRPQDFRSDLYGLGCMLYATLTGSPPFIAADLIAVMRKQLRTPSPALPEVLSDGRAPSAGLIQLYRSLTEKAPGDRPASTEAVVAAFEALALARAAPPDPGPTQPRGAPPPRSATLVDAPAMADTTEASLDRLTQDEDPIRAPSDAQTAPTQRRTSEIEPAVTLLEQTAPPTDGSADELDTPLALTEGGASDSSDDILTTIVPQGLDHASDDNGPGDLEGPVLGPSLLVPRPWPQDEPDEPAEPDDGATHPLVPIALAPLATASSTPVPARASTPVPSRRPAIEIAARGLGPADPAERPRAGAPLRASRWMMGLLLIAAATVGVAAAMAWVRGGSPAEVAAPPAAPAPSASPRAPSETIRISTVPAGARVLVQGQDRGRTPLWIPRPAPGAVAEIRLERSGYSSRRVVVDSSAEQVQVRLQPAR